MKAEDLMVGDLVTFKGYQEDETPSIIEIVGIGYQGEDEEDCFVRIDGADACDIIRIDDEIVGIPLTPEILERNGFVLQEDVVGMFGVTIAPHYTRDDLPFEVFCDGDPFAIWFSDPIDIAYVHQLQHVIRLCGVNQEIVL